MILTNLKDKAVLVTGGTRGIGLAIVTRLLESQARVAFCGTSRHSVDKALSHLGAAEDRVFGAVADVSDPAAAEVLVRSAADRFGRLDALINNAGVGAFKPVAELSPAEWERMIGLNLSGVYYCCHAVLPIFKQQQNGDVINIGSLAGKNPFAGGAGYNASKFGLIGFSEAMMLDHRQDGVRVSCVMPGSVATEFGGGPAGAGAAWKIAPEDVAEIVVTLLSMPPRTTISRVEVRPSRPPVPGKSAKQ